jgi:hypothetical protein
MEVRAVTRTTWRRVAMFVAVVVGSAGWLVLKEFGW